MQKTNHPPLPPSLKKKRLKSILMRIIPCAILVAAVAAAIILLGDSLFPFEERYDGRSYDGIRIAFYIVLLLVPFIITGVPFKLIDKSFCGTVTSVDIMDGTGIYTSGGGEIWHYHKNDLVLTIKKDDGTTVKYKTLSLGIKDSPVADVPVTGKIEHHEDRYRVGDRVYKYYGFKHLFVCQDDKRARKHCIACGAFNDIENEECWSCRSELIKITLQQDIN